MAEIRPKRFELGPGCTVTIRAAIPPDAPSIIDFLRAVLKGADWSVTQSHEMDATIEKETEWIEDHRNSPGKLVLTAEADGEVIGLLHFANGARERNRHAGTLGISVREDWRRRGIGRLLMLTLMEWARSNPLIEKISLTVFNTNEPAISLYHQMGFIEEGRQKREYRISEGRYVDGIMMAQFTKNSKDT